MNEFFKWITYLGDGLIIILFSVLLMFFNFRLGLFILFSYTVSGIFTQILKSNFFDDENRPFYFYSYYNFKINIVEGVDMHIHNSFPSGHSTAAWSFFVGLSLIAKKNKFKFLMLFIGLITSFSRVYLSQHFFEDIFAGAVIGSIFSVLAYWLLYLSNFSKKLENSNYPLHQMIRKK